MSRSLASTIVVIGGASDLIHSLDYTPIFHQLVSVASAPSRFTATDLRTLQTISYFHYNHDKGDWNIAPLTGIRPWIVPYTGVLPGIHAVHILSETLPPELISPAIDGTIVAIVVTEEEELQLSTPPSEGEPNQLPMLTHNISPARAFCAGLAVIRAVDRSAGELHLLTPIPLAEIAGWDSAGTAVVLVRGRLELPVWEMMVPGAGKIPWVSFGGPLERVWKVRRNVMRKSHRNCSK